MQCTTLDRLSFDTDALDIKCSLSSVDRVFLFSLLTSFPMSSTTTTTTTHTNESIQLRHIYHYNNEEEESSVPSSAFKDPLSLKPKIQTDHYIKKDLKGQKKLQAFYRNQNEMIETMLSALDPATDVEEQEKQLLKVYICLLVALISWELTKIVQIS